VLNRVLLQLKDNYVEPERIQPGKMLVSALESIQNSLAEVVIAYEHREDDKPPSHIDVTVGDKTRRFDVRNIESLWEMSFRLKEIFLFMEQNLESDPERKIQDIEYAAINGLLSTLDPHSNLLPPVQYEEMQTQTGGKFGGLGIVISIRDGQLTVISPIDGTPAAQKGIKAQDTIVRIGEESTINMNLNEAVNMLRGEPGTDVDLWIHRKSWPEPRQFTVTRAIIKIDSIDSQPLANKVGYIRIKNFQANTYSDLVTHLKRLKERMGGMQGLVLDMRDNPGGLLDQSIRVSDLFLNDGTVVSTVGVGNKLRETKQATRRARVPDRRARQRRQCLGQ
jgi:carboxyl-terminal processing protease